MLNNKISLKALRVNINKTQEDIAKVLKVSLSTYKVFENDSTKMSFGQARILADYYGISLDIIA